MAPSRGGTPQLSFRVGHLGPALDERVDTTPDASTRAQVAQRDLGRYYELLAAGRRELHAAGLGEPELSAICDVLNGALILWDTGATADDPRPRMTAESVVGAICLELHDGDRLNAIGEKWNVRIDSLIERLRAMPTLAVWALADGVERFWRSPRLDLETAELLREVGLLP